MPRSFALARPSSYSWWRHSLWIIPTFTLGLLNWLAFFYIGLRARRIEWLVSGFIYLLPLVFTAVFDDTSLFLPFLAVQIAASVVSILQALLVRPHYRAIMLGGGAAGMLPEPPQGSPSIERLTLPKGFDEAVAEVILGAQRTLDEIMAAAQKAREEAVRNRVIALCIIAERILVELRDEPRRAELAGLPRLLPAGSTQNRARLRRPGRPRGALVGGASHARPGHRLARQRRARL